MTFSDDAAAALTAAVTGRVLLRGDPALAAAAASHNTIVRHDPEVLVAASSEADVIAAVDFARRHGLAFAVLATGHGGPPAVTDGMLVTTAGLSELVIDPERRLARIGAGNRWVAVIAAAAEHGLAPVAGSSDSVGVIGYTLGGGLGPFARTFGFSSDWARGFRLVTAAGEAISVTADAHPELFWALRGGKGGFGVVTSVDLELVPLRAFYGGALFFEAEHVPAVLNAWALFTGSAPESATTSVALARFPPLETVPEPLRGETVLMLRFAFAGDPEEGERVFALLREAAPSFLGRVGEMPAADVAQVHDDPRDPMPVWDRGMMLDRVDGEFVEAFLDCVGPARQVPLVVAEVRHLGGATARDVPGGSAVGGRAGAFTLVLIGAPDPALFEAVLPAVGNEIADRLAPWVSASTTVNFAGDLSVPGSFEAAWPPDVAARLVRVRAAYDPDGLFRYPTVAR